MIALSRQICRKLNGRLSKLDTSREVLDWALHDMDFGVIDVNFLAHLPTIKGQLVSAEASHTMYGKLTHVMHSLIRVGTENWRRSSLCTFGIPSSGQFQRHDLDLGSTGAELSSTPRSS